MAKMGICQSLKWPFVVDENGDLSVIKMGFVVDGNGDLSVTK